MIGIGKSVDLDYRLVLLFNIVFRDLTDHYLSKSDGNSPISF